MSLVRNKDGALELSIGTIVVIVIGMSMLILGLVLVRTIFSGSTEAIDILNEKVQGEIVSLFAAEGSDVVIKLGSDRVLKVKKGENTNVGIGARKSDGGSIEGRDDLKYKLTLEAQTQTNCRNPGTNGENTRNMFVTPLDQNRAFDAATPSAVFASIELRAPENFATCTQKVYVRVQTKEGSFVGEEFFIVEVVKSGIF